MKTINQFSPQGRILAQAVVDTLALEGITSKIETTYRDFGQDWGWETIIVYKNGAKGFSTDSYQALSPRQWDALNEGNFSGFDIKEIVSTAKRLAL